MRLIVVEMRRSTNVPIMFHIELLPRTPYLANLADLLAYDGLVGNVFGGCEGPQPCQA
jgi:hypothetical protein